MPQAYKRLAPILFGAAVIAALVMFTAISGANGPSGPSEEVVYAIRARTATSTSDSHVYEIFAGGSSPTRLDLGQIGLGHEDFASYFDGDAFALLRFAADCGYTLNKERCSGEGEYMFEKVLGDGRTAAIYIVGSVAIGEEGSFNILRVGYGLSYDEREACEYATGHYMRMIPPKEEYARDPGFRPYEHSSMNNGKRGFSMDQIMIVAYTFIAGTTPNPNNASPFYLYEDWDYPENAGYGEVRYWRPAEESGGPYI